MKNVLICFTLTFLLVVSSAPISARGGGGGGGRGGGGTPSMSRAAGRPAASGQRVQQRNAPQARTQARPQAGLEANRRVMSQNLQQNRPQQMQQGAQVNRGNFGTPSMSNLQRSLAAHGVQNQGNIRDAAKQYRQQKPFRGDISKVPQARQENVRAALPQKFQGQRQTASRVGDNVRRNHPNYQDWFSPAFNARHNFTPSYNLRGNGWRGRGWGDLNSWLGYGWTSPYYYDYGYPVDLSADYENDYGPSVDGNQYAEDQAPPSSEDQWLSLGVFAAGRNEAQAAYSDLFVQMAVDKQGDLAGTYYNATTDQTHALDGYVDQKTQEAFWRLSDKPDAPLMSTGIFNLTQDVLPVTVAFSSSNEQNWVLVRVNEAAR
jgi:hypothetical protein